jgi:hypothetical protein
LKQKWEEEIEGIDCTNNFCGINGGGACPPEDLKSVTFKLGDIFYIIESTGYTVKNYKGFDCAMVIA